MPEPTYTLKSAVFDKDRVYRYLLTRVWDATKARLPFCMLNPSTADEEILDPTLRRCVGFAMDLGYGGIEITNAFALRSTDPKALYAHSDPVGPMNDAAIADVARHAGVVVAGWGHHGEHLGRAAKVREIIESTGAVVLCLGRTKDGYPRHPLYLKRSTPLEAL